jgi:ABC-type lipoprotein release transport system permease subunit
MFSSSFFHFLTLQLFKERKRHIATLMLSTLVVFLLASVLFLSSSLRHTLFETLEAEPDFVVTKLQGGESTATPMVWMDELVEIYGISQVTPRLYGRYFFKDKGQSALIVGVDFLEEQGHKGLEELVETIEIKSLMQGEKMLVGEGVRRYLDEHFYEKSYKFLTPNGEFLTVEVADSLPRSTNLLSNDMMIMPLELAQTILGYGDDEVSDIAFNVVNPDEWQKILEKVSALHYDLRVVTKEEVKKSYENLYNYKGGLFLVLFLTLLSTFLLILYQRYSMVYSSEKRQIGLLRAMGWSIGDLLRLKFFETLIVVLFAFILGVIFAYIYIFIFDAPLLSGIFLGGENLANHVTFRPWVELSTLSSIFLLYALPSIASVVIPVWRVAITDAKEAML